MPGKPILSVHPTQENTLLVKWEPPLDTEGQVLGYRLQFGRKDVPPPATLEFSSQEDQYVATNIHQGATYVFRLSVKSRAGIGEEAFQELTIPEDAPKGYPQILEASNVTSRSVQVHWLPPVLAERNGAIVKYTVAYREALALPGNPPQEKELPPSPENSYTLNGLKPNTAYDVKIRAHTSKGAGPYSPSVQYRTFLLDQGRDLGNLLLSLSLFLSCASEAVEEKKPI